MVYCNKECQKAAWQAHRWASHRSQAMRTNSRVPSRTMCRSTPAIGTTNYKELGYGTPIALATAPGEWLRIHTWSLNTIVDATVYLEGGIDAVLSSGSPVFSMVVTAGNATANEGNPAHAFDTYHCKMIRKDDHVNLQSFWSKIEAHCDSVAKQLHVQGAFNEPIFGGLLPAVYVIHGTDICVFQTHAVLRLPIRHVKDDPRDEHTRATFRELQELLRVVISQGTVFRCATTAAQPEPNLGYLFRDGKAWNWRCMDPQVWDQFDKIFGEMTKFNTDIAPRALVSLFDTRNSTLRVCVLPSNNGIAFHQHGTARPVYHQEQSSPIYSTSMTTHPTS